MKELEKTQDTLKKGSQKLDDMLKKLEREQVSIRKLNSGLHNPTFSSKRCIENSARYLCRVPAEFLIVTFLILCFRCLEKS